MEVLQGRGLGTLLIPRLIAAAAERGVHTLHNEVLGSNLASQELARGGSADATVRYEQGVATIEFRLPHVEASAPPAAAPRDSAVYDFLRLAAEGLVELKDRFVAVLSAGAHGASAAAPAPRDTELTEDDGPGDH